MLWCVALLVASVAAANPLILGYEELEGRAFVGKTELFKQFAFSFGACARNFLSQKDIFVFTYSPQKRECRGFVSITGYGTPVKGTKTYFIKREGLSFQEFLGKSGLLGCTKGWERFQKRCYKKIEVRYSPNVTEATDLIYNGCSKNSGSSRAQALSIHGQDETNFISERTGREWPLIGLIAPHRRCCKSFKWSDGTPVDYNNWSDGEPNNLNGDEFLAQIYENGKWNDIYFKEAKSVSLWCYYELMH
ncbi:hypothetical protein QR680_012309 [Steinernema hermaphroditum]|uniref:C-type lectin domain-containing protein n=1 Tax=Steinernema hermaphroditum TaxID=289476 RepID=A0AA39I1L9_9BILA|nr:hypothetical protein QR680_012309 [Steinernema hermaphroditum]